jgi:hypothetical protein
MKMKTSCTLALIGLILVAEQASAQTSFSLDHPINFTEVAGWVALKGTIQISRQLLPNLPLQIQLSPDVGNCVAYVTIGDTVPVSFIRRLWVPPSTSYWGLKVNIVDKPLGSRVMTTLTRGDLTLEVKQCDTTEILTVADLSNARQWWHFPCKIRSLYADDIKLVMSEISHLEDLRPVQAVTAAFDAYENQDNSSAKRRDVKVALENYCTTLGEWAVTEKMQLLNYRLGLLSQEHVDQIESVLRILFQLRGHRECRDFLKPVLFHWHPRLRAAAAGCLGMQGDISGIGQAMELLHHEDPNVRADACWALSKIGDTVNARRALPIVRELLKLVGYPRDQAMHAIANLVLNDYIPIVRSWVDSSDSSPGARVHATMALYRLINAGHDSLTGLYVRLLDDRETAVRRLAIRQSKWILRKDIENALARIVLEDSDESIRVDAVRALTRSESRILFAYESRLRQYKGDLGAILEKYFSVIKK